MKLDTRREMTCENVLSRLRCVAACSKNIQQQFGLTFYVLKLEGLVRESAITSYGSSNPGMTIATGMYPRLAVTGIMPPQLWQTHSDNLQRCRNS